MSKSEAEILALARKVEAVIFDVDGVLTPDVEYLLPGGPIIKARSHNDGQGISLLRAIGLPVVFITAEADTSPGCDCIRRLVDKWNGLPSVRRPDNPTGWPLVRLYTGTDNAKDKGDLLREWLVEAGMSAEDCAVMGDDLVDVPMLKLAGFKVAPAQAELVVRQMADWVTPRPGGAGAVRDLANLILTAWGIDQLNLPTK